MRSTTQEAAEIRATLRRKYGWGSRQVSVRSEYFSLGSAIRIEVKDAAISVGRIVLAEVG